VCHFVSSKSDLRVKVAQTDGSVIYRHWADIFCAAVCPSVAYESDNSKTKMRGKTKIGLNVSQGWSSRCRLPIFSSKSLKSGLGLRSVCWRKRRGRRTAAYYVSTGPTSSLVDSRISLYRDTLTTNTLPLNINNESSVQQRRRFRQHKRNPVRF